MTRIKKIAYLLRWFISSPKEFLISISKGSIIRMGYKFAKTTAHTNLAENPVSRETPSNPLLHYFNNHKEGKGIWKWEHYFEIYHNHFKKFIGKEVHLVEVGVFSGGSIEMWKEYFGDKCYVYGVDIEPACKNYESERVKIFIGDQSSKDFWQRFKQGVPKIDIFIDDGGHLAYQQIPTIEEMLSHISPGGIYLCEDIHQSTNDFAYYINGLQHGLNEWRFKSQNPLTLHTSEIQRSIKGIYNYPFVVVIEKNEFKNAELKAPKMGTSWETFLS